VTDITVATLTNCQVSTDGECVRLVFVDEAGGHGSLALPAVSLPALLMTLPALATAALRAQHGDSSLRMVYPLGGFRLEAAAGCPSRILTLATPDGFEVAFELRPETVEALHTAIAMEAPNAVALQ
jgi:hypothetical protein